MIQVEEARFVDCGAGPFERALIASARRETWSVERKRALAAAVREKQPAAVFPTRLVAAAVAAGAIVAGAAAGARAYEHERHGSVRLVRDDLRGAARRISGQAAAVSVRPAPIVVVSTSDLPTVPEPVSRTRRAARGRPAPVP